ncbi:hypothetical protein IAU59_000963 [Kwoniella sp. CBS 9459]
MSDANPSNPLQRAHALSAQANELLRPASPSPVSLNTALRYYQEAADLFQAASNSSVGGGEQGKTLRMLVVQHRKLAKDVERRINTMPRVGSSDYGSSVTSPPAAGRASAGNLLRPFGSPETVAPRPGLAQRRVVSEAGPAHLRGGEAMSGLAVGMNGPSLQSTAGIASRLSPPRGIPPFALRPPSSFPSITSAATSPSTHGASGNTATNTTRATQVVQQPSLSPLYSSSSSSSAPEESYIHFGPSPDASKMDPFSRFWGMLENMLEEVSNPVVFASAPMGPDVPPPQSSSKARGSDDKKREKKERRRTQGKERSSGKSAAAPEESFYMVQKGKQRESSEDEDEDEEKEDDDVEVGKGGASAAGSKKTPEELLMENESLKTSLDALSLHAQSVERNNQLLKIQLAERERGLRTAVEGIKREANRGKEVWKSQLFTASPTTSTSISVPKPNRNTLASVPAGSSAGGFGSAGAGAVQGSEVAPDSSANAAGKADPSVARDAPAVGRDEEVSRRRIQELEEQVRSLKLENEKQRGQIDKYRDRIDKIKINARAKKEAKLAAEAEARAASPRV